MLAARTGGTVRNPEMKKPTHFPKVSVEKDTKKTTLDQMQLKARRAALLREMEMTWYLKACELSHEYTVAYMSGMPHR